MSLVSGAVQMAISMFSIPLTSRDMEYVTVSGEDQRVLSETRSFSAAVDPSRSHELERIFGGSIGDGDIGVYTSEELYIDDAHDADASDPGRRQTFVDYGGFVYRVAQRADWRPLAGVSVYLCKRHVPQDEL